MDGTELGPWNLVFQIAQHEKLHPDACWVTLPREPRSLHSYLRVLQTCRPVTGCGKNIHHVKQEVKFIATLPPFLPSMPSWASLMLQTDGAEEFRCSLMAFDFPWIFFFFFLEHIKSSSKSLLLPSLRALLAPQCLHQIFDPSAIIALPAPPLSAALHDGTIC